MVFEDVEYYSTFSFFRLTPLYTIMLLFYMGIFPYMLEGPFQQVVGYDATTNCRDYWYLNILYVNNLVDPLHKMVRAFPRNPCSQ